jgi:hypothetical protein
MNRLWCRLGLHIRWHECSSCNTWRCLLCAARHADRSCERGMA